MRIVVNDIAASEGGALSVLRDFYDEIIDKNDDNEWVFLLGDQYLEKKENIKIECYPKIKKSWFQRILFDLFYGRKVIDRMKPDLYVSLQNTATLGLSVPQFVYVHQVLPYQKEKDFSFFERSEQKLAVYQKIIGKLYNFLFKKSKAKLIVQSQWLKNEINKKLDNKITVIKPKISLIKTTHQNFSNIFFYPAADMVYKNHAVIFKAVDYIIKKGYKDFKVVLTIPKRKIDHQNNYIFTGQVDRKGVFRHYQKSFLLFPSYIESYGLPLAEAKAFGTIILASDTEFAQEVLADYPNKYYFEKDDYKTLGNLMVQCLEKTIKPSNQDYKVLEEKDDTLLEFLLKQR